MIADDMVDLIQVFEESDLTELSIEQNGRKLFLRKGDKMELAEVQQPVSQAPRELTIKAHMVGTFHWTKDKSSKPALALHQRVEKGHVVGFIEAMGILNEVEAPDAGEVVEIAVAGGQPVEYGQTLLVLEPAA